MLNDLRDSGVAAVLERHRQYWCNEEAAGQRPLFSFRAARPIEGTGHTEPVLPPEPLEAAAFREGTERRYAASGLLHDDLFHLVSTGIPSEVLVGCAMARRAGTLWAENCFRDWRQLDDYRVEDTLWFRRLLDNTKRAVDAVDPGRYPFCCMAFRGAVDMAEAMMGGAALCAAIVDQPRALKHLLARITDITIRVASAHGALVPTFAGGQFNSYGMWTPGRTVTFTLDGGVLVSPATYEEFFLPCDQRLCAAFDTPFVHLHAASHHHFPAWTEIPNLGLQCVIDQAWLPGGSNLPIGPQLEELLPAFQRIRQRKSLMLYGYLDEATVARAATALPPGGNAITGMVEDLEGMRRKYL